MPSDLKLPTAFLYERVTVALLYRRTLNRRVALQENVTVVLLNRKENLQELDAGDLVGLHHPSDHRVQHHQARLRFVVQLMRVLAKPTLRLFQVGELHLTLSTAFSHGRVTVAFLYAGKGPYRNLMPAIWWGFIIQGETVLRMCRLI